MRFIGNRSSGKQGFAIAQAAIDRGAEVTLIVGASALPTPYGAQRMTSNRRRNVRGGAGHLP